MVLNHGQINGIDSTHNQGKLTLKFKSCCIISAKSETKII